MNLAQPVQPPTSIRTRYIPIHAMPNEQPEATSPQHPLQYYSAPPLLQRMIDAGLLGRKSGRGFYPYDNRGGTQ